MIHPRLRLAKDLLREDGVIFISIDDNEVANLKSICDEIYGTENFIAQFIWKCRNFTDARSLTKVSTDHEYLICYARSTKAKLRGNPRDETKYKNPDNDPRGAWMSRSILGLATKDQRPNLHYPITDPSSGITFEPPSDNGWRYSKERMGNLIKEGSIIFPSNPSGRPREKKYREDIEDDYTSFPTIIDDVFTSHGTAEIKEIFETKIFDFPKPHEIIRRLIEQATSSDSIILDFFSGSASTAHAVMQLNAGDGGKRRFIMVQLPEDCTEGCEAAKAGYKTIAEIGKERIRRVGEKIKEELQSKHAEWKKKQALESKKGEKLELDEDASEESNPYVIDPDSLDLGFRSFRIEDTKINWLKKDLRGEQLEFSDKTTQDALDFVPGFTDVDVVYELMLRQSNIPLTGTITQPDGTGKRTYLYADTFLICLEEKVTKELVETLAALEPTPAKYIFRDSAFGKDIALKDETFRRLKAEIEKHHGDTGSTYTVEFI
ncbi:MAG: site-specific DNA-methyltransferase, partial [Luteolibacter sp.]